MNEYGEYSVRLYICVCGAIPGCSRTFAEPGMQQKRAD